MKISDELDKQTTRANRFKTTINMFLMFDDKSYLEKVLEDDAKNRVDLKSKNLQASYF